MPQLRRRVFRLMRWGLLLIVSAFLLQRASYPTETLWNAVVLRVSDHQFDYLGWEVEAIARKTAQSLWGSHAYLNESARSAEVCAYFSDLAAVQGVEARIANGDSTPERRAERDTLRADLAGRQLHVEAILEGQVSAVLVDMGFGTLGQLIPPMAMHFTQVPNLLIVSPRDAIRFDVSINLDPLPLEQIEALEARVESALDVSALIVPLGGIALYPAMILETSSLSWAVETFAHEWLHHHLFMYPLGWAYDFDGEARLINETAADLFGKEVMRAVLTRYYPPQTCGPDWPSPPPAPPPTPAPDPNAFDFGAALHETRVQVDALLAAGDVAGAEAYMETRRQLFEQNGWRIRRLNQAFFAFYGGYQGGQTAGAAGTDPIGPALRQLRADSDSLHHFIASLRGLTTRADVLALAESTRESKRLRTASARGAHPFSGAELRSAAHPR